MTAQLAADLYELFRVESYRTDDADEHDRLRACAEHWLMRAAELEEREER
jgi:hypothetical protein